MTVNLSALLTKKSGKGGCVCRRRGEGQDKAFSNSLLLIKAYCGEKREAGTVTL